ncbi:hypothetical protein AX16_003974 [Volvariella volvacea WC 439]|nr:hypothetical protein AX16_003974 [Volvariella volvacea WC 439]
MSPRSRRKRESSPSASDASTSQRAPKTRKVSAAAPFDDASDAEPIKVYLVQAKLDVATIANLYSLLEKHKGPSCGPAFQVCKDPSDATVIVTAVRMRQRLLRHVDEDVARHKAIVTPQWLRDSIKQHRLLPCGDYAALSDLRDETITNCPDDARTSISLSASSYEASFLSPIPTHTRSNLKYDARYSCARASPMVCPNQDLADQLDIIRRSRELEGLERNALGYERAIAAIKAYPYSITTRNLQEFQSLPYIGAKMRAKVEEYYLTGVVSESETIRQTARYQSLAKFTEIYGIGPKTARDLYDKGLRTLEDLEKYYNVPKNTDVSLLQVKNEYTPNGRSIPQSQIPHLPIQVSLMLRKDFEAKISREEVEAMRDVVMGELDRIKPGCVSTIVGGYRRGKLESNDVDIVFGHPGIKSNGPEVKGLCKALVQRLHNRGIITNVMHLSSFRPHNALRTTHWDSLEKALTVFILPPDHPICKNSPRKHHRLDLIFATPEAYWTAVVGWTGSKMFERDLRSVAKDQGLKFDSSGLMRRRDSKLYFPKSEKEIFDILGLEWVDPTMRNADA